MSELTTIDANNYAAMAEMMGTAYDTKEKKGGLSRLRIVKQAIMGDAEVNGKTIKAELVSAGSMALDNGEKQSVFADSVVIRPFLQRFMYQRYDNDKGSYQKTVMANNLDIDLKDNFGTFNCGKPSGYIQDFSALSEDMKTLIRTIKRTRVLYGTVSLSGVTKEGDAMDIEDLPFVWDVDTKEGYKNIGTTISQLGREQKLLMSHPWIITTEKRDLPTGFSYYVPVVDWDESTLFEIDDNDKQLFTEFTQHVEGHNKWVMDEWDKAYQEDEPSSEEADDFITVEVAEVD